MKKILVSACLLGERVRYNGKIIPVENPVMAQWHKEGRLISFCPEVAGGLPVPRPPAEISGDGGPAVLAGKAEVMDKSGERVTASFIAGAYRALEIARTENVTLAILKDGSPSCGSIRIYDGSFSGISLSGQGVTTAILEKYGIRVFGEQHIAEAAAYAAQMENQE